MFSLWSASWVMGKQMAHRIKKHVKGEQYENNVKRNTHTKKDKQIKVSSFISVVFLSVKVTLRFSKHS